MKLWEVESMQRGVAHPHFLAIKTLVGFVFDVISGFNYLLWYEETSASRFLHSSNKI